MNAPSNLTLREQLHDLAQQTPVGSDLLTGALRRAGRRRRRQVVGTGVVTVAAVAGGFVLVQSPSVRTVPAPPGGSPSAGVSAVPLPTRSGGPVLPAPSYTEQPPSIPEVVGTVDRASALTFKGRDVFAVDAATGDRRRILRLSEWAAGDLPTPNSGSLSADGTKLAVPSNALGYDATGIWVLDLPTGEGHLYPTGSEKIGAVSWSPDGRRLWAVRWGGGAAWTLGVAGTGTFTPIPGVTEYDLFWNGTGELVNSDGGWRVVDLRGRVVRTLPQLAGYAGGTTWTPAEFAGWSPDGHRLAVIRRDGAGTAFGAVDVATGRVARTWGPFRDGLNTQNVIGWTGPTTMVAMVRAPGSTTSLRLLELDAATGTSRVLKTYDDTDSAYLPVAGP